MQNNRIYKKPTKTDKNQKHKTIKLDAETHRLLRIYAAENDLWLSEAVRTLLGKFTRK